MPTSIEAYWRGPTPPANHRPRLRKSLRHALDELIGCLYRCVYSAKAISQWQLNTLPTHTFRWLNLSQVNTAQLTQKQLRKATSSQIRTLTTKKRFENNPQTLTYIAYKNLATLLAAQKYQLTDQQIDALTPAQKLTLLFVACRQDKTDLRDQLIPFCKALDTTHKQQAWHVLRHDAFLQILVRDLITDPDAFLTPFKEEADFTNYLHYVEDPSTLPPRAKLRLYIHTGNNTLLEHCKKGITPEEKGAIWNHYAPNPRLLPFIADDYLRQEQYERFCNTLESPEACAYFIDNAPFRNEALMKLSIKPLRLKAYMQKHTNQQEIINWLNFYYHQEQLPLIALSGEATFQAALHNFRLQVGEP
ncbi:MAG: hypothetical protein KDK65_05350 [Chlamydiia bacterium]|nr:hypothetical protein [Chlamydiia bacterium]